jgi:hypothetical protein
MRVYSIKQNTKTKKKQRSCFTAFKNSVFTSARTCDCSTNGKWKLCETGRGTAKCLAIQVFFLELIFFEET